MTIAILGVSGFSQAADIEAGKTKSATCVACHGANGISPSPIWPNLAGQKEAYLKKQILAFRDGQRQDPSMAAMVANLSDEDAADLAAYFCQSENLKQLHLTGAGHCCSG